MVTDAWINQLYWVARDMQKPNTFNLFLHIQNQQQSHVCIYAQMLRQIRCEIYLITAGEETNLQEINIILLFVQNKSARIRHTLNHNN